VIKLAILNPLLLFGFIYSLVIVFLGAILFKMKLFDHKEKLIILGTSIVIAGFIIQGPPVIRQLQNLISSLLQGNQIQIILLIGLPILFVTILIVGRFFCGYPCPVGALQEFVYELPFGKVTINQKTANIVRAIVFLVMILLAGFAGFSLFGFLDIYLIFSLTSLLIMIPSLTAVIFVSIFVYRPWCRILCPFGFIAWVLGRASIFKIDRNENCNECYICESVCPTREAHEKSSKGECYLCNRCIEACPYNALDYSFTLKKE
jgi:polyferredoxin